MNGFFYCLREPPTALVCPFLPLTIPPTPNAALPAFSPLPLPPTRDMHSFLLPPAYVRQNSTRAALTVTGWTDDGLLTLRCCGFRYSGMRALNRPAAFSTRVLHFVPSILRLFIWTKKKKKTFCHPLPPPAAPPHTHLYPTTRYHTTFPPTPHHHLLVLLDIICAVLWRKWTKHYLRHSMSVTAFGVAWWAVCRDGRQLDVDDAYAVDWRTTLRCLPRRVEQLAVWTFRWDLGMTLLPFPRPAPAPLTPLREPRRLLLTTTPPPHYACTTTWRAFCPAGHAGLLVRPHHHHTTPRYPTPPHPAHLATTAALHHHTTYTPGAALPVTWRHPTYLHSYRRARWRHSRAHAKGGGGRAPLPFCGSGTALQARASPRVPTVGPAFTPLCHTGLLLFFMPPARRTPLYLSCLPIRSLYSRWQAGARMVAPLRGGRRHSGSPRIPQHRRLFCKTTNCYRATCWRLPGYAQHIQIPSYWDVHSTIAAMDTCHCSSPRLYL